MKKVILAILIIMVCGTGFCVHAETTKSGKADKIGNCLNKYYKFLNGEISASKSGNGNSKIDISDIFLLDENYNKFTFFDSNHNGIPELHLSSMREYDIIECINDKLVIIYSGTGYDKLLNNGALLYTRSGGGPENISYVYTELGSNNKIVRTNFSKYSKNNNGKYDLYLFKDKQVSKSEFDKKTKNFLNINSDLIIWSDYWTFLAEKNYNFKPQTGKQ